MPSKSRKTQDSNEGEKVYDIFFSYNANDDKWVKEAVHKLETKEKLKCAFAQRDFVPGKPVLKNIALCVQRARVMVLVLSPSFVKSGWCTYEAQVGLTDHLTREQMMVVPVILKRCDTPYFISHLTHLNAQGKNFWKQFTEIVRKPSNSQGLHGNCEILREYAFGEKVDPLNGKIITTEKPSDRFLTNFDAEKIHRSLISKGISISEHDLGEALERLGNTTFVAVWRYHWPLLFSIMFIFWVYALYKTANLCVQFQNMATTIIFIIIGCLGFVFSSTQIDQRSVVTAIEVVINQWTKRSGNYFGNILFLKLFELYIVYCVIVIWLSIINDYVMWLPDIYGYLMIEDGDVIKNALELVRLWSIFTAHVSLPIGLSIVTIRSRVIHEERANTVFLEHKMMVGLVRRGLVRRCFVLAFVYFNPDKCKKWLERYLKQGSEKTGSADVYLNKTCGMFIRRLVDNSMPTPVSGPRHTKHGLCLCQLVESEYFGELV